VNEQASTISVRRLLAPDLEEARPKYGPFRAGDARHSLADISKARRLLGYEPTHRLGEGLRVAVEWYECAKAPVWT
jgi:nucleoside-diphosphate-sugar epimerase